LSDREWIREAKLRDARPVARSESVRVFQPTQYQP
jgi:hypothetical protein